jgi:hypothetical protein
MSTTDMKLKQAYEAAEAKRRKAAITRDRNTIPFDFDIVENPGTYAEDPIWKRYWKTEGVRALNPDGSVITDQMERFRLAFELGYQACRKIEKVPLKYPVTGLDVPDYPEGGE